MILVYPVITMGDKGHQGSRNNLLGKNPAAKLVELFSNEKQVSANTPPTFLAHAKDDRPVPPENSRMFYDALRAHKVTAHYLELPSGGHGLNGYQGPMWDAWQKRSLSCLPRRNWFHHRNNKPPHSGSQTEFGNQNGGGWTFPVRQAGS
jgi:acetyl esterase/lipase